MTISGQGWTEVQNQIQHQVLDEGRHWGHQQTTKTTNTVSKLNNCIVLS